MHFPPCLQLDPLRCKNFRGFFLKVYVATPPPVSEPHAWSLRWIFFNHRGVLYLSSAIEQRGLLIEDGVEASGRSGGCHADLKPLPACLPVPPGVPNAAPPRAPEADRLLAGAVQLPADKHGAGHGPLFFSGGIPPPPRLRPGRILRYWAGTPRPDLRGGVVPWRGTRPRHFRYPPLLVQ